MHEICMHYVLYEVEFFETGQLNDLWGQPYIAHDKAIDV